MATANQGFILSLPASGDLSANEFLAHSIDSSGEAALTGAGLSMDGILLNKPDAAGKAASLQTSRIAKYVAGTGGTSAGDNLEVEAGGDLITESAGIVVGRALEDVAVGGIGSFLIKT